MANGYRNALVQQIKDAGQELINRAESMVHTLFYLCELADFEIEGRIILVDKRNGRVWR